MNKENNECIVIITLIIDIINVEIKVNKETIPIKLNINDIYNEYKLNILFLKNEYKICLNEKEENMIENILKDLNTNKKYSILFQEKHYSLNTKQLLVIIIDKFIQIIKKEYIIKEIQFKIETKNFEIIKIINNLYYSLGYENIKINNEIIKITKENPTIITKNDMKIIDTIINENEKYMRQKEMILKLQLKENKMYTEEKINK